MAQYDRALGPVVATSDQFTPFHSQVSVVLLPPKSTVLPRAES